MIGSRILSVIWGKFKKPGGKTDITGRKNTIIVIPAMLVLFENAVIPAGF